MLIENKYNEIINNPMLINTDRYINKNGIRFYTQSTRIYQQGFIMGVTYVAIPKKYNLEAGKPELSFVFEIPMTTIDTNYFTKESINRFIDEYGIFEFRKWLNEVDELKSYKGKFLVNNDYYRSLENFNGIPKFPLNFNEEERLNKIAEDTILSNYYYNYKKRPISIEELKELAFVPDSNFNFVIDKLNKQGFIETKEYNLTSEGIAYYKNIDLYKTESNQYSRTVFIAQSFSEEIMNIYNTIYEPTIKEFKLNPIIISKEETENTVDNEILNQISQCKFMICDLTLERPSVYFEAGYALGLGIKIFYTCRKDHNSDDPKYKPDGFKTHFDVRNRKITFWDKDNLVQLREELKSRIGQFLESQKS